MNEFVIKEEFNISPEKLFNAWLDSETHSIMTGGEANCSSEINHTFDAWDGYISGKNLEIILNKKIVQTWRTTDFEDYHPDSIITIEFREKGDNCELILSHINIPDVDADYQEGWNEYYFKPMKEYFN